MSSSSYDIWGGPVIAPVLVAVSLPVLAREAKREGNRGLFWFLLAALLIHLGLGWFGRVVAYDIYHGAADVGQYHQNGVDLAEQFRHGVFAINLPGGFGGTNWPGVVAGSLYAITGPTTLGGFLFFGWLGFWGCFFFYRAFKLAVPEGRARTYRWLLYFLPSLAFWTSYMGKDAWMVFAMGIAALGSRGSSPATSCGDSSPSRLARPACWSCVPLSGAWWAWRWSSRSCSRGPGPSRGSLLRS